MGLFRRFIFNFWYFRRPPWDSGITPPELLEFIRSHPAGRAIDLGCGTGTNIITLAQHGWQATGIDFAGRAIRMARKKAQHAGVTADFQVGDVTCLDDISGPFDFALDLGCFHGLSEREKGLYLNQLDRILLPGGFWFIYGFVHLSPGQTTPGLDPHELERIQIRFALVSRKDGYERGKRPSAYFLFQKVQYV